MRTEASGNTTTPLNSGVKVEAAQPSAAGGIGDSKGGRTDSVSHGLLLILAIGVAWLPVETHPWTAVAVAASVLLLIPWGWRRTGQTALGSLVAGAAVVVLLSCSAAAGWDVPRAVGHIGLAMAVGALVWLASRLRPPAYFPALLAVGFAGLAVWGMWQVFGGLEAIEPGLDALASPARAYAEERLAGRRAFASLPLPSHLAVLLATALPLLLVRARPTPTGVFWIGSAVLAAVGLAAARSPVGLGLALVAVVPVLVRRSRLILRLAVGCLLVILVAVVAIRPDVAAMEPVLLRFDNWRTAVWLWTTSPVSGVGVGSFAQASQANPLSVGNRPAHAHSFPAEGLAELGVVGLAGVLFFGGCLVLLMRRLWKDHRALAVAIAVIPLHNLVDFSLFVSGVALPWAVLLGWAVNQGFPGDRRPQEAPTRGRALLVCVVTIVLGVVTLHASSFFVEQSAAAAASSTARFDGALQALKTAPWRVEPQFLLATSAIVSKERSLQDRAWHELDRLRWLRPRSAALAERRARLALARGDVSSALAELWAAHEYGVSGTGSEMALGELVESIEKVGDDPSD